MGIDIYASWEGMTKKEKEAQFTGFSVTSGHVGYLREAYHGSPYATKFLVKEAFEAENSEADIPARVLRERLPETLEIVKERERKVYNEMDEKEINKIRKSYMDFVELCEKMEKKTGKPVTILASY